MTPEREADLFAKMDLLLDMFRGIDRRMVSIESRMDRQDDRLREIEGSVRELTGRITEQSNILQVAIASPIGRSKPAA